MIDTWKNYITIKNIFGKKWLNDNRNSGHPGSQVVFLKSKLPATAPAFLDSLVSRFCHSALFNELRRQFLVLPGLDVACSSRAEPLPEGVFVNPVHLTIYPAITQRFLNCLEVPEYVLLRVLLV